MNISKVQAHRPALGNLKSFIEVGLCTLGAGERAGEATQPGAGEEAKGKEIMVASAADAVHRALQGLAAGIKLAERSAFQNRLAKGGAGEGEVVEGNGG